MTSTTSSVVLKLHSCSGSRADNAGGRADTPHSPVTFSHEDEMRSFLLVVSAGIMIALIAVGSNMAKTARAQAHAAVIAAKR